MKEYYHARLYTQPFMIIYDRILTFKITYYFMYDFICSRIIMFNHA